ncbi:MAG: TlyA family RNA methyltransferase [Micrococcaceae bacterium]
MQRLDVELTERKLAKSRSQAQELIAHGHININGQRAKKASLKVKDSDVLEVLEKPKYVSRAGLKLEAALDHFNIDVTGLEVLDAGASTGGFTDVLLQRNARKIWAIDVGHKQLDSTLRKHPQVIVREGFNIRDLTLENLDGTVDMVVGDLSFISLTLVLQPLAEVTKEQGNIVLLIKPQFEVGKENLARTGVVTSEKLRKDAVAKVMTAAAKLGLEERGLMKSPLQGGHGNIEYIAFFQKKHLN